uniref:Fido domain-containing protein n=1 Tax=Globodera pallida TaxID=36090 RepID=A0A183BX86_GLOPA
MAGGRFAGQIRNRDVVVVDNNGHIIYIPPRTLEVERLVAQFINELNTALAAVAAREEEATTVAAWAHYRLVALHPFHDGNGRASRLLMNLVLTRAGLAPLILPSGSRARYNELLRASNHGRLGGICVVHHVPTPVHG